MSFDFGLKRIGVAVGQTTTNSGTPLTTINAKSGNPDPATLERILAEWQPALAIVGRAEHRESKLSTPGSSDQLSNKQFAKARNTFIGMLQSKYALEVAVVDEALTTSAANRLLAEQGVKAHNRAALRDRFAALEILKTWMNEEAIS